MIDRHTYPSLLVSESAHAQISVAARQAHPNETGGILIGVYREGQPWVIAAIEIAADEPARHRYKIPFGTTQPAVYTARRSDDRLGYLGDWHSHPSDVGPSPTDLATLALISLRHPRTPNPTLVIARCTPAGYLLDARRIIRAGLKECDVRFSGNLPPLDPTQSSRTGTDPDH